MQSALAQKPAQNPNIKPCSQFDSVIQFESVWDHMNGTRKHVWEHTEKGQTMTGKDYIYFHESNNNSIYNLILCTYLLTS